MKRTTGPASMGRSFCEKSFRVDWRGRKWERDIIYSSSSSSSPPCFPVSTAGRATTVRDSRQCTQPSPPRSASCQRQPWPRMEPSASRRDPSTSHRVACRPRLDHVSHHHMSDGGRGIHTELDAGVFIANLVTLLVGEEHVGGKTTLRHVGVWKDSQHRSTGAVEVRRPTLLLLAASGLVGGLLGATGGCLLLGHVCGGCRSGLL